MKKFTYITANNRSATCVQTTANLNVKEIDPALKIFEAGHALLEQLSKPLAELTRTEFLYEYRRLAEKAIGDDEEKLKLGGKALRSLRSNPELAKRFKAMATISIKKYKQTETITTKVGSIIAVPEDLRKIITIDSNVSVFMVLTHDGEIQTYIQVSNPTTESELLDASISMGWKFAHGIESLNGKVDPKIIEASIADIMERINATVKGDL